MTSLDFEGDWTVNLSATSIFPTVCRTSSYTAGTNETAIVNVSATVILATGNNFLFVAGAVNENSTGFTPINAFFSVAGTANGVGTASNTTILPLTAGRTYVFAAMLRANSATTVAQGVCQGSVLIAKP